MLHQILATFQHRQTSLSLDDLSRQLSVEPSVLEGMLRTLIAKGRLIALADDGSSCRSCPLKRGCSGCGTGAKGYMLAENV